MTRSPAKFTSAELWLATFKLESDEALILRGSGVEKVTVKQ